MKGSLLRFVYMLFFCIFISLALNAQSIEQRLAVVRNDMTAGGSFQIEIQVKHTGLPVPNFSTTLGSATVDVSYDSTKLSFFNASNWAFSSALGYNRTATNNTTTSIPKTKFIRVLVLGTSVGVDGPGDPPGFDISNTYTTWVRLNFTITQAIGTTDLTIRSSSNAIGVFQNHSNNPNTSVINNVTLSAPENINDVTLPVELTAFTATAEEDKIVLKWTTQSEVNNLGFEVYRSAEETGNYAMIASFENTPALQGGGNSNTAREYTYEDAIISNGGTYWYQIADVDYQGVRTFHGPVSAQAPDLIPEAYALRPNYPNPFNPETTIRFEVPADPASNGKIALTIYNNLGMAVRSLVSGSVQPGIHTVKWDGRNDRGDQMASGIYFLRLQAGSFVQTQKMLLVR